MGQKEKEKKEDTLRQLAQQVREERAGLRPANRDDDEEVSERDNLRQERHRDRQRERNLARAAPGDKKSKFERRREITEQIALGMPARPSGNGEVMYDERLLNKTRGMDSGFADDDLTMSTTNLGVWLATCSNISIVLPRTSIKINTATTWIILSKPTNLFLTRISVELTALVSLVLAQVLYSLRKKKILSVSTNF